MIVLKKTPNEDSEYEITTIKLSVDDSHMNAEELVEVFKDFMLAIGYHPNTVNKYLEEK